MNPTIQIQSMITSIAHTMEEYKALLQMTISLIILNLLLVMSTVYIMQGDQDLIPMIMNPTMQIQSMIPSIAYTMEEYKALFQMTISLIILNLLLVMSTVYIMQGDQD